MSTKPYQQASADDVDLSDVWGTVRRHLGKIAVATLAVGGLTYVGASLLTPSFSSEARIQLSSGRDDLKSVTGGNLEEPVDREAVRSEVQVLLSRDLGAQVASDLRLETKPEFNDALDTSFLATLLGGGSQGTEQQRVMSAFAQRLQVFEVKDSRVIAVRFSAAEPELAAKVANTLSEKFISNRKTTRAATTKGTSDWLVDEVNTLRGEVAKAESAAAEFRAKSGLLRGQNNSTLNSQELGELTTQLSQAQSQKADAETRARSVRSVLKRGAAIEAHPEVLKSPFLQRLMEQQARVKRERSQLSATLLPRHPRMRQLSSELAGLRQQVRAEVRKIVISIEDEARIAASRVALLQSNLDALKNTASARSGDMAKIQVLEREAKSKRDLLETYLARLGDAKARGKVASVPVFAQIIQTATPARVADFPKKIPMTLLAMVATLLVGGGLAVTRGLFLSARNARAQEVARAGYTGPERALSRAPAMPAPVAEYRPGHVSPDRAVGDARQVAMQLDGLTQNVTGYRTLVSFDQDLGGSVRKVLQVAGELSRLGRRVLVIDWTAGDSAIATVVGGVSANGIREVIAGTTTREHATISATAHGCDLITGGVTGLPAEGQADAVNRGFDQFDPLYDHVLVCGQSADVTDLFSLLEGRFDAGLVLAETQDRSAQQGVFLGFEVPDMDILRFVGAGESASAGSQARALRAQFSTPSAGVAPAE